MVVENALQQPSQGVGVEPRRRRHGHRLAEPVDRTLHLRQPTDDGCYGHRFGADILHRGRGALRALRDRRQSARSLVEEHVAWPDQYPDCPRPATS